MIRGLIAAGVLWAAMAVALMFGYLVIAAMFVLFVAIGVLMWPFSDPPRVVVLPAIPEDQAVLLAAHEEEFSPAAQRLARRHSRRSEVTR